jgi:hypothetical protein
LLLHQGSRGSPAFAEDDGGASFVSAGSQYAPAPIQPAIVEYLSQKIAKHTPRR